MFLMQNTARNRLFLLVNSNDHITGFTGAGSSPIVTISKDGGVFAPSVGMVSEIGSGWYKLALAPGDTDTLGDLAVHITAAGADPTDFADQVLAALPGAVTPADIRYVNGYPVKGSGRPGDEWGPQ